MSCDTCSNRDNCPIRSFHETLTCEDRLVGIGMRCWLAGIDSGDIGCWQTGWQRYASELGEARAKSAFTELGCWARKLHANTARKIEYESIDCPEFCRDECMAVAMIAACQHDMCPALKICTETLLGIEDADDVLDGAMNFARNLENSGIMLGRNTAEQLGALAAG